jgi:hypothetical protein
MPKTKMLDSNENLKTPQPLNTPDDSGEDKIGQETCDKMNP